jgi:hypothetical protein
MLYTPVPGTPLYREMADQGRLLDGVDLADIHGQDRFNFRHAAISQAESRTFLEDAFRSDFERNGPSLFRICRTTFQGWKRYKNHPDPRVRRRIRRDGATLRAYAAVLWAMERRLRDVNQPVVAEIAALRRQIEEEFGVATRATTRLFGPMLWWTSRREDRRLAKGSRHEPPTIIGRRNWAEV